MVIVHSMFNSMSLIQLISFLSKCGTSEVCHDRIINTVCLNTVCSQLFNDAVNIVSGYV
jgi:hypothetical protein